MFIYFKKPLSHLCHYLDLTLQISILPVIRSSAAGNRINSIRWIHDRLLVLRFHSVTLRIRWTFQIDKTIKKICSKIAIGLSINVLCSMKRIYIIISSLNWNYVDLHTMQPRWFHWLKPMNIGSFVFRYHSWSNYRRLERNGLEITWLPIGEQ